MVVWDIQVFFWNVIAPFIHQMKFYGFSQMAQTRAVGLLCLCLFVRDMILSPIFYKYGVGFDEIEGDVEENIIPAVSPVFWELASHSLRSFC